ncbi:hypothetical protein [Streptomyces sp. NRRL F-525]|uniref:hypothetical protein n=1 Tax=Streptomyces sp. NRRL F-525 TaxID=1463861 RepID=UPI00068E3D60|nr:hypothetical protein [Streptomyces sp. NRRL F-525]
MPADCPDRGRVDAFFRRRREYGLLAKFHDRLRGTVREREGREAEPTAGIIDAQSVRAASRGYDGGTKVPGLRDPARHQRGDDPLVGGHADERASGTATGRRPARC